MGGVAVHRTEHRIVADARRVIAKPYLPGEELTPGGNERTGLLMRRIMTLPEAEVGPLLAGVLAAFSSRHEAFEDMLERHFELVSHHVRGLARPSRERRLLIGAYYTHEYAIEGAALFNPSLVPDPDQSGLGPGERRMIMSLRAVGEGHISSIEFRTVVLGAGGEVHVEPPSTPLVTGERMPPRHYDRHLFGVKLDELRAGNEIAESVLGGLGERFSGAELEESLRRLEADGPPHAVRFETTKIIRALAASNYVAVFPANSALSSRILFPAGPHETRGMEDARFVRFVDDDGAVKYVATYTAYDGFEILPQLIETDDFVTFTISTLNGAAAQNKGMALFPRRIDGKYVMLSRKDRENLHLASSSELRFWNDVVELDRPSAAWELVQIGNCGSPLETEAGWLVLTHGVGPMRRYAIGALLLDLDDPRRVRGRLRTPLLEPDEAEREGYVPNVVYSCGAAIHGDHLVLPYGQSDGAVGIAVASVAELVAALVAGG
jgi:predicted GH43/DUF377 family glycosyl hydrolase